MLSLACLTLWNFVLSEVSKLVEQRWSGSWLGLFKSTAPVCHCFLLLGEFLQGF